MVEMLGLGEEVVGREARIVAVQCVHSRLDVKGAAVERIERRNRAEAAQRNWEERGETLVEELPVVVEERIRVEEVGRHDLADRVLEAIVSEVLTQICLRDPDIECAPRGGWQRE